MYNVKCTCMYMYMYEVVQAKFNNKININGEQFRSGKSYLLYSIHKTGYVHNRMTDQAHVLRSDLRSLVRPSASN